MATQYQNYKSDFVLRESFVDITGKAVPLPTDIDFTLRYWTQHGREYVASRQGGVYTNCTPEGGDLLVFFKAHNLCEGELHHELHLQLDNPAFEGGVQNVFYPADLHILLWDKPSSTDKQGSALVADYTRGNAFTYDDFTPEQIEQLQRPAQEAADRYDKAMAEYDTKASEQVARIEKSATELEGLVGKFGSESAELVATMNSTTDEARKAVEAAEQRTAAAVKAATDAAAEAHSGQTKRHNVRPPHRTPQQQQRRRRPQPHGRHRRPPTQPARPSGRQTRQHRPHGQLLGTRHQTPRRRGRQHMKPAPP